MGRSWLCGTRAMARDRGLLPGHLPYTAIRKSVSLLLVVVAILSLSWQSFVTQTHLHSATPSLSRAAKVVLPAPSPQKENQRPQDKPANCPICQALAATGDYLLPSLSVILAPDSAEVWLSPSALPKLAVSRASHFWHSRGPPRILQV